MTNEKRYEQCCDALRAAAILMEMDDSAALIKLYEKDPTAASNTPYFPILAAIAPIMQEARENMDKAVTPAATLSALKRIAKECPRDYMRGVWTDKEGRACVCSGSHAVRVKGVKVDSIPTVAPWSGMEQCMQRPTELHPVTLPTIAECKTFKASHGKYDPMPIDEGRRYVDPSRMIDMLQALPGATASAGAKQSDPIWFDTDKGDGLLMPMRPPVAATA